MDGNTGDANLPRVVGPSHANLAYWLLAAGVAAMNVAVGVLATRASGAAGVRPWRQGAIIGVIVGAIWLVLSFLSGLVTTTNPAAGGELVVINLLGLVALGWAGFLGARRTGRLDVAVLTAFWAALVMALCFAVAQLLLAAGFGDALIRGGWSGDPDCAAYAGTAHRSCILGDHLGDASTFLVEWPLVGLLLGLIGGLLGRIGRSKDAGKGPAPAQPELVIPMALSGAFAFVLAAELAFKIW